MINTGIKLKDLLKRPEIDYDGLEIVDRNRPDLSSEVKEQVSIQVKYEGYINRQLKQVEQFKKLEDRKIPEDINYEQIKNLRIEARQKLGRIRPGSLGQLKNSRSFACGHFCNCYIFRYNEKGQIIGKEMN